MPSPLRLFDPNTNEHPLQTVPAAVVGVRLGDLLPVLLQAVDGNHAWVRDFYDDNIDIPQDFYEVVLAYQQQTRQTA